MEPTLEDSRGSCGALGDAARLPYADCVFDRVICTYSFNVIPLYQQALDEVSRVLKTLLKNVVLRRR
jgi:ubiquinone/menaquinone biosynthesis C-methylase UbiE